MIVRQKEGKGYMITILILILVIVLLSLAVVVFAVKYFVYRAGGKALVRYMREKGYPPPSEEELRVYSYGILKELFHIR